MITCLLCQREFVCITATHMRKAHQSTVADYKSQFPGVPTEDCLARKTRWTPEARAKKGADTAAWSATPEGQAALKARKHWSEGPNKDAILVKIIAKNKSPERRAGTSMLMRKRWAKLSTEERHDEAMKIWTNLHGGDGSGYAAFCAAQKRVNNDPEVNKRQTAGRKASSSAHHFTSKAERKLGDLLHVPPEHRQYWIDGIGEVDLADPKHKIAIEVQGCYWHGCSSCGFLVPGNKNQKERDALKAQRLEEASWTLVVVWEHQLQRVRPKKVLASLLFRRLLALPGLLGCWSGSRRLADQACHDHSRTRVSHAARGACVNGRRGGHASPMKKFIPIIVAIVLGLTGLVGCSNWIAKFKADPIAQVTSLLVDLEQIVSIGTVVFDQVKPLLPSADQPVAQATFDKLVLEIHAGGAALQTALAAAKSAGGPTPDLGAAFVNAENAVKAFQAFIDTLHSHPALAGKSLSTGRADLAAAVTRFSASKPLEGPLRQTRRGRYRAPSTISTSSLCRRCRLCRPFRCQRRSSFLLLALLSGCLPHTYNSASTSLALRGHGLRALLGQPFSLLTGTC